MAHDALGVLDRSGCENEGVRNLRLLLRGLLFVALGLGLGAVGVRTAVAARYAGVDRVDNVPSIWLAAAACIGGLAILAMAAVLVVAARRSTDRLWLVALAVAPLGALSWQSVPDPPSQVLTVGLFVLFASPVLIVAAVVAAILLTAGWFERFATRAR